MEKKIEKGKKMHLTYNLQTEDKKIIYRYLCGEIGSRELGKSLGMSHQGAISAITKIVKDWLDCGQLRFTNKLLEEIFPDDKGMRYFETHNPELKN